LKGEHRVLGPTARTWRLPPTATGKWQLFLSNPDALKPVCLTDGHCQLRCRPALARAERKSRSWSDKTSFGGSRDLWVYDFFAPVFQQLTKDAKVTAYCWVNAGTIVYSAGGDTSLLYSVDVESKTSGPAYPRRSAETIPRNLSPFYRDRAHPPG